MNQVIKASGNKVEPYWPGLFAKALDGQDISKLLSNVGTAAPAGGAPAAGGAAPAEAAKKEGKTNPLQRIFSSSCINDFDALFSFYRTQEGGGRRGRRRYGRSLRWRRRLLSAAHQSGSEAIRICRVEGRMSQLEYIECSELNHVRLA